MTSSGGSALTQKSKAWKGIWHAEAPARCKSLAWRACREELPVKAAMVERSMTGDGACPWCGAWRETTLHALLLCEEARRVWFASPLGLRVEWLRNVGTMAEWIEECAEVLDEKGMGMVCAVMWALWHKRNVWVFENKKIDFTQVMNVAYSVLLPDGPQQWLPPNNPFVKANFDALLKDNVGIGFGLVFRDSFGSPLASGTNFVDEKYFEPETAHALCYKWALEQSGDLGFSHIIFETDCQKLHIQWMKAQEKTNGVSKLNSLLEECRIMIQDTCSSLTLVRPSANKVAQSLATLAFDYGEKVWMGVVPEEASTYLKSDMASANLSANQ